jgi:hypothetical protein
MKKLLLLLLCLPCIVNAQDSVRVVEIKAEPYTYPVIQYKNKRVEDKVNKGIISIFLDTANFNISTIKDSINEAALLVKDDSYDWINHYRMGGLVSLDYGKTYNKDGFLSIYLAGEYLGAYISGITEDAVFDLKTGNRLLFEEVIDKDTAAFRNMICSRMKDYVKESMVDTLNYDIDCRNEFDRIKNELLTFPDEYRKHFYIGNNYSISDYGIAFSINVYDFPHVMQMCNLVYVEQLSWKELSMFVSPKSPLYRLLKIKTK